MTRQSAILLAGLIGLTSTSNGIASKPAPIDGYKDFKFGMTHDEAQAVVGGRLKGPEAIGQSPDAFFPGVTLLVDGLAGEVRVLDAPAQMFLYFHEGKLGEVRIYRQLVSGEKMRSEPYFDEIAGLLAEKYGPAVEDGRIQYKNLPTLDRMKEDENRFQWVKWTRDGGFLGFALERMGLTPVLVFRYRTEAYNRYSEEQSKKKSLGDL